VGDAADDATELLAVAFSELGGSRVEAGGGAYVGGEDDSDAGGAGEGEQEEGGIDVVGDLALLLSLAQLGHAVGVFGVGVAAVGRVGIAVLGIGADRRTRAP
jgi:hypothetical protein